MGDVGEAPAPDFLAEPLDLDCLLEGFSDNPTLDLSSDIWNSEPSPEESKFPDSVNSGPSTEPWIPDLPPEQSDSPDSVSSFVKDIENFLMEDGEGGEEVIDDEILTGFFSDISTDSGKSEVATPEAEPELEPERAVVESEAKEKSEASPAVDVEDDDPISKKRRRQMRNRDSAMKSRERKKTYIKDLEMKNKYLESECRRLNYALQCCVAENMALHQRLQERSLGASLAKQESAVLFVASFQGAVYWSIIFWMFRWVDRAWHPTVLVIPAAGFPVLASEHRVPIPLLRPETKGCKRTGKRSRSSGSGGGRKGSK